MTNESRIYESLKRVAKKTFKDSPQDGDKFVANSLTNIKFATDPAESLTQVRLTNQRSVLILFTNETEYYYNIDQSEIRINMT